MVDNKIKIGGVQFNKNDVKKSEVVKKDGKEINSVFLRDGTHVEYPTQNDKNKSNISMTDIEEIKRSGFGIDIFEEDITINVGQPWVIGVGDKKVKTGDVKINFERINDATITGTDKKDDYTLEGCKNSTVDISQKDNKNDAVKVKDSKVNTGSAISGNTEYYQSSGNTVKLGEKGDSATIPNKLNSKKILWTAEQEHHGEKTVKED